MQIRIVGDIHNKYECYFNIIKDCEYSIQIGDMGFDYRSLYEVHSLKHVFFGGNHDNYDKYDEADHSMGDYGHIFDKSIFFVRGAWSIDGKSRQQRMKNDFTCPKIWWEQEELSLEVLDKAVEEYAKVKPRIMLTHEAPFSILPFMNLRLSFAQSFGYDTNHIPTKTNLALERMLQIHKPEIWCHGHFHTDFNRVIDGIHFMCLTADYINYPNLKQRFFDIEV